MTERKINVLRGRTLSLEGARLIGAGATGRVYLLSDDNVVKVLFSTDFQAAERELLLSKWAFRKGLATAISYDVVDVDGHPGLLYESLGRDNLRNHLRDDPGQLTPLLEQYLALLQSIHAIEVEKGQLPSARQRSRTMLQDSRSYLTEAEYDQALALMDTIPEDDHMIHGDCHIKNIKIADGRFFLIDLDTLSVGDPIFELSGLCAAYHAYSGKCVDEAGYNHFFEIDDGIVQATYCYIMEHYFGKIGDEAVQENRTKTELLTYLQMLCYLNPEDPAEQNLLPEMLKGIRARLPVVPDLVLKR